jgi:tetratricopeptide (TPR) repeat protein
MKIAVLPFNTAEGTKPAYGRQFAQFTAEQLRNVAEAEINSVNLLTQIEQDGVQRTAYANLGDVLLPHEQLKELFEQAQVDFVQDGTLSLTDETFSLVLRYHAKGTIEPVFQEEVSFPKAELFERLRWILSKQAEYSEATMPEGFSAESLQFGTEDPEVFLAFLEGFDALNYVSQSEGAVVQEFNPQLPLDALVEAFDKDRNFVGVYQLLVQFARACANFRIGNFEMLEEALKKAVELNPNDFLGYFGLGDLYQQVGMMDQAANSFEKAIQRNDTDPGLYNRLGVTQMQMNMPVNAERNFAKALELEGPDKPSADYLAAVLQQSGRDHEIPAIWKGIIDGDAQNGQAHAKYAVSLINAGKKEDGERAFETGLEVVEDNTVIKRYYAPYLAGNDDLDRAMDFYEDVLDVAPNDVQTLVEYAQTLEKADRAFEVPRVLKDILSSNPDPNTRAEVLAKLIELEQPKRAENVEAARAKLEQEDYQGAIRDLKPLRNWLADYWKLWALLSTAYNRVGQFSDAEDSAVRLIELYPGCEPAYGELVQALNGQDRSEEAYNIMRQVAAANPSSLPIHLNFGLAAAAAGHNDEARALAKSIRDAIGPNEELEPILAEIER